MTNLRSGVNRAKPTRLLQTPSDDVVLGARIGPSGRPARRLSSVLPFADGKAVALAVGFGWAGSESLVLLPALPPPQPATAISARGATMRERRTGRILGTTAQFALNWPPRAAGRGQTSSRSMVGTIASSRCKTQ